MARFRAILILLCAALLLPGAALAQTFPTLTGPVVDQANILPPEVEARISQKLVALKAQSQREVTVATLASLEGYEISDYGYRLGRQWGLGDKARNDAAILIIAPNERKLRIEVGYGLEPVLTDGLSSLIISRQIVPKFKAGDMPGGVEAGTDAIIQQLTLPADQALQNVAKAEAQAKSSSQDFPYQLFFWLAIFFLFFLLPLMRRMAGGKRYRRGSGIGSVIVWEVLNAAVRSGGSGGGGWSGGGGGGVGGSWGGGGGSFGGGGASGSW
jgi:uncharacterized protein